LKKLLYSQLGSSLRMCIQGKQYIGDLAPHLQRALGCSWGILYYTNYMPCTAISADGWRKCWTGWWSQAKLRRDRHIYTRDAQSLMMTAVWSPA